jgi:peptidoglycan/LPS O-acetylase OafA/YrhL
LSFQGSRRSTRSGEKDNFRPDIEGLRGVAVLLVVFFHAGLLSNASFQVTGGFIGVDLFFVVSGFLITGLLIRERERTGSVSFSRFYARRVRRILPAAAVTLLITIPLSYGLVTLLRRPDTMWDAASAALSFANVRFALTTDYFNPVTYSPFLHFWSLGVEEQFYFIWPALLLVAAWRMQRPSVGAFLALSAVVVLSFAASVYETEQNPSWAFYMLPTRAYQLAAGGLLAIGAGSLARLPGALQHLTSRLLVVVGWLALAGLFADAFAIDSTTVPYPGTAALVPTVAAVLLIASGMEAHGPGVFLRLMPIRFIGKISYSLYLWHWPMLILGGLYLNGADQLNALVPGQIQQILTPQQAIVLAIFSIPVATVSWGLVEEPFRRGFIRLPRPSRTVVAGVTVMALVAAVGTSFNFTAQNALAALDATPVAEASDTPQPADTPTDAPTTTPSPTPQPSFSVPPGETPTPTPWLTPALTPAPAKQPTSYAVAGLAPSVGAAPKDYEAPWKNNCLGWEPTTVPPAWGKCVYGNPSGTFQVALIGDSHGSALFPAGNEVAKAHGWKLVVYLKIDCSFVDIPITDINLKRTYTECATWNNNVIARLKAHPPDLAIVHMSRWIFNVNSSDASYTAQGNAMAREMEKIPQQTKVVMVTDIPDPWNMSVPDCLSTHPSDYRSCAYARSTGFGSYWGKREAVASKAAGVPLIDPSQWICPGSGSTRCPAVLNGMIIFRDQHHLTATFAKSLGPALDAQLVPILLASMAAPSPSPPPSFPGGF